MVLVELTLGEARALLGADPPEAASDRYPYHLLDRAQLNVGRALRGLPRVPDTDDARPEPAPGAPRLVVRRGSS